jgi:alpha-mannosidase
MAETRRKLVRTTANQLALIDRYPGYRFAASSAQHYAWLEEDDPELYSRVLEAIAAGRWEVVGGSWVEPDCNLPDGESLIRQLLVGQRWFEEHSAAVARSIGVPTPSATTGRCRRSCASAGSSAS